LFVDPIKRDYYGEGTAAALDKYRSEALQRGAARAAVLRAADIRVDERVLLKCRVPRCFGYGAGAHCPPHTLRPRELQELLQLYHWAVFFTLDVPPEVIVRDRATIQERVTAYREVFRIVSELESLAFYDGYYLAVGFAAGSCRHTFCGQLDNCAALEGGKCRFSLRARPSMEAVGMDVFRMAADQGWDIYPIGSGVTAAEVPRGTLAGILII
jgi:predicted metal-binding protein